MLTLGTVIVTVMLSSSSSEELLELSESLLELELLSESLQEESLLELEELGGVGKQEIMKIQEKRLKIPIFQ